MRAPDRAVTAFGTEFQQDWLYYLSEQQYETVRDVVDASEHVLSGVEPYSAFVVGGPGTGKTSVLLNLLKDFADLGDSVNLVASDHVVNYIGACLPDIQVERFRAYLRDQPVTPDGKWPSIILVDDPGDYTDISNALSLARNGSVRMVVLGFDPFQLRHPLTDRVLEQWVTEFGVRMFPLDECYRQKANVGAQAKRVVDTIASSTPFLAAPKIARFRDERLGLTELANALSFPNPHGYVEIYADPTSEDFTAESARVRQGPTWSHWPYLLVVVDDELWDTASELRARDSPGARVVRLHDVESVKGVEFQHVFALITRDEYTRMEAGVAGMGQRQYDRLKLLRIPVSRAKDSLVFFVINQS